MGSALNDVTRELGACLGVAVMGSVAASRYIHSLGASLTGLSGAARRVASRQAAEGLLEPAPLDAGRAVLTRRGRLLADAVVRDLTD